MGLRVAKSHLSGNTPAEEDYMVQGCVCVCVACQISTGIVPSAEEQCCSNTHSAVGLFTSRRGESRRNGIKIKKIEVVLEQGSRNVASRVCVLLLIDEESMFQILMSGIDRDPSSRARLFVTVGPKYDAAVQVSRAFASGG